MAPTAVGAPALAEAASGADAGAAGFWQGHVYKLRSFPCNPPRGSARGAEYVQTMGRLTLRHALTGPAVDLAPQDLVVELSSSEMRVRAPERRGLDEHFAAVTGDFHAAIRRDLSWWILEREPSGENVLTVSLAKREHKAWTAVWKLGMNHQRKSFGWAPGQRSEVKKAEDIPVKVKMGRLVRPEQDPFVINREALCQALEDGQDETTAVIRIHLEKAALAKACETVCASDLFGVDIMERYLKVFIRGDERSPILMGQLGGACMPDLTRWEIVKATLPDDCEDPGAAAGRRAPQYGSCLQVTIAKSFDSRGRWPRILIESSSALEREAAPSSLEEVKAKTAPRAPSPDRTGWTPEDHAKEAKGKADECFKKNEWRDAVVYYTRAIGHTPDDEKLYSNRAACYVKLRKNDKALADAKKCISLKPNWPKAYFRQGQALRGLQKFEEAITAFKDGQFRDPANPDWAKEVTKTEEEQAKWDAHCAEQRRLKREADMTTELNEATVVAEREAMIVVAEQALKAGKSRKEAGELAMKGAELAKQRVHEMAEKKKSMMVEDDLEISEPAPYRIVCEDGAVHPRAFCHTERGTYFMGMVVMNADRPPQSQPWVEIRHPGKLRWTQGCAQVRMKVTLPESVKSAAEIEVTVTTTSVRIGTVGDSDPVVVGDFERKVDPDGENYSWFLIPDEKPPMLELCVDKDASEVYQTFSYGTLLWPRLFKDDFELGEGLFEADLTDLPPHLLEKWQREQAKANERSRNDRDRRQRLTEEEVMEEVTRNWNAEFARHGMPTRFDTNEERMLESATRAGRM